MTDAIQELRHQGREIAALAAHIRELVGDDDLAFIDTLEGATDAVEAASGTLRTIAAMDAMSAAAAALARRYAARAKDFSDRGDRGRNAFAQFLADIGETKLVLPEGTVSLTKGRASLVGDADPESLPDDLVRVKREPNRSAIKAALEAGRTVEGFSLSNSAPGLQIRPATKASAPDGD
jgi:hypothetical protein